MRLTGELNNDVINTIVRETLEKRFPAFRLTDLDISYVSRATFVMDDEPAVPEPEVPPVVVLDDAPVS